MMRECSDACVKAGKTDLQFRGLPIAGRRAGKRGFTLIELLAVISIIVLLMGILVPSISSARRQAKRTKSNSVILAMSKGAEMFRNEMNQFPKSNGGNPFEASSYSGTPSVSLSGAQWFALQMAGADLRGYVKPESGNNAPGSDTAGVEKIDQKDWLDWYSLNPKRAYSRLGPYVTVDGKLAQSPESFSRLNPLAGGNMPTSFNGGSSDWKNSKIPFFVDAFEYPILYYLANAAEKANAVWKNSTTIGCYDQTDNAQFTGADGANGRYAGASSENGWDLSGNGKPHPFKILGFTDTRTQPPTESFTGQIYDLNRFSISKDSSGKGNVWPHNSDSFLLISPGPDGLYGTDDDIRNYQTQ